MSSDSLDNLRERPGSSLEEELSFVAPPHCRNRSENILCFTGKSQALSQYSLQIPPSPFNRVALHLSGWVCQR